MNCARCWAAAKTFYPSWKPANALAPAAIRTAANLAAMGADADYVTREAVADVVLWLCSDAARAVTGQVVRVR